MDLAALANAARENPAASPNHSVLLYGDPKTGKTQLAGTAIGIPEFKRIVWIDIENGIETLFKMGFSNEQLKRVTVFKIPDTKQEPRAIETVLKMFSNQAVNICHTHGKVGCMEPACRTAENYTPFDLKSMTHDDLIVLDSGSQLGDSALALAMLGRDVTAKAGWDEYGAQSAWLSSILSVIQAGKYTNVLVITHSLVVEEEVNGVKKDKVYPLMGTKAFSAKCGKYFGTIAYVEKKMNKHVAGSSSLYKLDGITGSRIGAKLESAKESPDLRALFVDAGVLKSA